MKSNAVYVAVFTGATDMYFRINVEMEMSRGTAHHAHMPRRTFLGAMTARTEWTGGVEAHRLVTT